MTDISFCQGRFVFYSFDKWSEEYFFTEGNEYENFTVFSEVEKIAATQKYDVIPVSCEILSDFTTPIETMKRLKNVSTHCYMLESAQADETWGRYTFLGFDPKMEITCIDGEMKIGNLKVKTDNPSDYLRQILADYRSPRFDNLPSFTGGLVGYFSYDYAFMQLWLRFAMA